MTDGEYKVYLVNFPGDVLGVVRIDEDGFASIYINDQLSPQAKRRVFLHEVKHIRRNDCFNGKTIREVEECPE